MSGGEITISTLKQDYELVERPKSIEDVVEEEFNKVVCLNDAWSEEDEKIIVKLHNALEAQNYYDGASGKYIVPHKEEINWLKSLKNRYTWKPSEEMLEALYRAIPENTMAISEDEILLDKLYQGLKYGRVLSKK